MFPNQLTSNEIVNAHTRELTSASLSLIYQLEIETKCAAFEELLTNGYIMIFYKLCNFYLNHSCNSLLYQLNSLNIL